MNEDLPSDARLPHRFDSNAIAGMNVLVVDDEQPTREVLSDILDAFGVSVLLAEDGPTGISIFAEKKQQINAVILDLSMPGMSGVEVAVELRMLDPDARIILSSGYTEDDVRRRYPNLQCNGFIQKPYKPDALCSIISQVASR
jgi:two-component system cell cycle sensor histidine kinase/response regulator CckA